MRSRCYLCVRARVYPPIVARQRLGKNPSLLGNASVKIPLSLLGNGSAKIPLIVARQRLGTNVTAVTNTHATIEELLDASFSMWPESYQGKQAISSSQNFLYC
jgi:hypothetical protein